MIEALSNPGTMIILLLLALALVGGAKAWRMRLEWALFQQWRQAGMPIPQQTTHTTSKPAEAIDITPLAGAGHALKNPTSDFRTLFAAIRAKGNEPYRVPLGWHTGGLVTARLVGDVNHILISGQSDAGKDNAVMGMLLSLAKQHTPQQVQFCIIDGKGLDWAGWGKKAHMWRLAIDSEDIAPTMNAISDERKRRGRILQAAGVAKWDEYEGNDLPLLVIFISELSLLEDATKSSELTSWLNSELAAGRAYGLRYIIGTQNASNFSTRWRGQIGLFLAGFQPSRAADEPNTMLGTAELESIGALPPSQLPPPPAGAGVFTAVQGREAVTIRTSYLPGQHRAWVLSTLPDRAEPLPIIAPRAARPAAPPSDHQDLLSLLHSGQPLPIADEPVEVSYRAIQSDKSTFVGHSVGHSTTADSRSVETMTTSYEVLPLADEIVPYEEQKRILETARSVKSRRQLTMQLYNTDGGQKSTWVRLVCDALGLLPAKSNT